MTSPARPIGRDDTFQPCTWEDVRLDQARRFAALTPDQKLDWLMEMLDLFPHIRRKGEPPAGRESVPSP